MTCFHMSFHCFIIRELLSAFFAHRFCQSMLSSMVHIQIISSLAHKITISALIWKDREVTFVRIISELNVMHFHNMSCERFLFQHQTTHVAFDFHIFHMSFLMLLKRFHITKGNSASADGGPRSRVRARGTLCSAPHWHFFRCTCLQSQFHQISPFSGQNMVN